MLNCHGYKSTHLLHCGERKKNIDFMVIRESVTCRHYLMYPPLIFTNFTQVNLGDGRVDSVDFQVSC